jgi:hypothetical protein
VAVLAKPVNAFAKFEFTILENGDVANVVLVSAGTRPLNSKIEKRYAEAAMQALKERKYPKSKISCQTNDTFWFGQPYDDA